MHRKFTFDAPRCDVDLKWEPTPKLWENRWYFMQEEKGWNLIPESDRIEILKVGGYTSVKKAPVLAFILVQKDASRAQELLSAEKYHPVTREYHTLIYKAVVANRINLHLPKMFAEANTYYGFWASEFGTRICYSNLRQSQLQLCRPDMLRDIMYGKVREVKTLCYSGEGDEAEGVGEVGSDENTSINDDGVSSGEVVTMVVESSEGDVADEGGQKSGQAGETADREVHVGAEATKGEAFTFRSNDFGNQLDLASVIPIAVDQTVIIPTTVIPTAVDQTTVIPTTVIPTTVDQTDQTTVIPTTVIPTAVDQTTVDQTTVIPTTVIPTAVDQTTVIPTTVIPTTVIPTAVDQTTVIPTTVIPTTVIPTTVDQTTVDQTTVIPTTVDQTAVDPTTVDQTTVIPTTVDQTTVIPITVDQTTVDQTVTDQTAVIPTATKSHFHEVDPKTYFDTAEQHEIRNPACTISLTVIRLEDGRTGALAKQFTTPINIPAGQTTLPGGEDRGFFEVLLSSLAPPLLEGILEASEDFGEPLDTERGTCVAVSAQRSIGISHKFIMFHLAAKDENGSTLDAFTGSIGTPLRIDFDEADRRGPMFRSGRLTVTYRVVAPKPLDRGVSTLGLIGGAISIPHAEWEAWRDEERVKMERRLVEMDGVKIKTGTPGLPDDLFTNPRSGGHPSTVGHEQRVDADVDVDMDRFVSSPPRRPRGSRAYPPTPPEYAVEKGPQYYASTSRNEGCNRPESPEQYYPGPPAAAGGHSPSPNSSASNQEVHQAGGDRVFDSPIDGSVFSPSLVQPWEDIFATEEDFDSAAAMQHAFGHYGVKFLLAYHRRIQDGHGSKGGQLREVIPASYLETNDEEAISEHFFAEFWEWLRDLPVITVMLLDDDGGREVKVCDNPRMGSETKTLSPEELVDILWTAVRMQCALKGMSEPDLKSTSVGHAKNIVDSWEIIRERVDTSEVRSWLRFDPQYNALTDESYAEHMRWIEVAAKVVRQTKPPAPKKRGNARARRAASKVERAIVKVRKVIPKGTKVRAGLKTWVEALVHLE